MSNKLKRKSDITDDKSSKKQALSKQEIIDTIAKTLKSKEMSESDEGEENSEEEEENEEEEDEENDDSSSDSDNEESKKHQSKERISSHDIQVARETAELFKSNIFKLQIDELIKEVKLKDYKISKIEKFLHKLYELIQEVPEFQPQPLEQVEKWFKNKKTVIPFNDPKPTNVNYKFEYKKPENVSIVGSFGLKTGIQSIHGLSIDVNVTMPKESFQQKDYLNYRALHKRAFYLGYLVENLRSIFKKEGLDFLKLSYSYLNGDILTPVLKLTATDSNLDSDYNFYKTKFSVNIIVGLPYRIFDPKKLLPNKNCIRVQKEEDLDLPATPLYNSSILTMTSYDYYLKFLYKAKKSTQQFKEACVLGRLWLSQRGLGSSVAKGGFGHFEFATLTASLLNGGGIQGNKILLHGFSSYQIFKGVIKYLATQDLSSDGYLQFYSDSSEVSKYIPGGFNTPTIFDKSSKINILHKVTKNSYTLLVHHAQKTLELLNDVIYDRFDALFLKNSDVDYLKFDYTLNLQLDSNYDDSFGPFEKITNLTYENFITNKISHLLKFGLGDRVKGFNIQVNNLNREFEISKRKPQQPSTISIQIGLLINPQESEKLVTKGPLESEDSEQFRSFWGSKSSLRRFKDGTISNSIVWNTDYKEPIVLSIINYIFKRHLKEDIKLESTIYDFNDLLPLPNIPSATKQPITSTITSINLVKSYDDFYRILTKLDLPLTLKSILPASPGLRSTSYVLPVPYAVSSKDFFNDLILQFETSSKWPDEIAALENVKTAFLLKIHEQLEKETAYKSFMTKDEHTIPYNFNITTLNILTPEGYGFRVRVLTERDEVLYLRAIENCKKEKRSELESIYIKFNQRYLGSVSHTRTISTISHHFPFYPPTVRLFKKWLDDQLLLPHFTEELIELIALKPFVDPAQFDTPSSVENGFFKILSFLSGWNWKEDPLILDLSSRPDEEDQDNEIVSKLSDKITVQTYHQIKSNFDNIRKQDPQGLKTQFFVASKIDKSGILWSKGIPLPIAARLTALSKVAIQLVNKNGVTKETIKLLFTASIADYDFVLKLKSNPLTLSSGVSPKKTKTFKNLIADNGSYPTDIVSKLDPIAKLASILSLKYKGKIIFSYKVNNISEDGENVLCGLFVPNTLQKSKFKVQLGYNFKPLAKEEVIINKEAVFNEILNYAGDLVVGFESKKEM